MQRRGLQRGERHLILDDSVRIGQRLSSVHTAFVEARVHFESEERTRNDLRFDIRNTQEVSLDEGPVHLLQHFERLSPKAFVLTAVLLHGTPSADSPTLAPIAAGDRGEHGHREEEALRAVGTRWLHR